jgi:drug/metabolite transporter (DMT)-like permease
MGIKMGNFLLFMCTTFIWGSTFYVVKIGFDVVSPEYSIAFRFLGSSFVLFVVSLMRKETIRMTFSQQKRLIIKGIFTFGMTYFFVYKAEIYMVTGLVSLVFVLVVMWNAVISRVFFGVGVEKKDVFAIVAALSGVILIGFDFVKIDPAQHRFIVDENFLTGTFLPY